MSRPTDGAAPQRKEATVKSVTPQANTRLRPWISARRPNGKRKTAAARMNDVATHPRTIASTPNSRPIVGRAIRTDDPMNGERKELSVDTNRAERRVAVASAPGAPSGSTGDPDVTPVVPGS